jgi:Flp pilus assembly protein TadD
MRPVPVLRATSILQGIAMATVLFVAVSLAWHPLEDLDIWFHHRAGQDLLTSGPLPPANHYSFTEPDHPWLNHEWLFQLLVHGFGPRAAPPAAEVGGWNLLRAGLVLALAVLLAGGDGGLSRLRGRGSAMAAAGSGLLLLFALGLLWPRLMLRPELLSYVALVLLVRWTEALRRAVPQEGAVAVRARRLADPRSTAGRVVWLTWLWAQTHGFSAVAPLIVGFGLLAPEPEGPLRWPARRNWRIAGAVVAASLVALLATPNGWQGLVFPVRALGQFGGEAADLRRTVAELVPLLRSPDALRTTILLFKASLVTGLVLAVFSWRRIGMLRLALWLAMAAAAWFSQRAIGPYAVAFALLGLRAGLPKGLHQRRRTGRSLADPLALAGTAAVLLVGLWWVQGIVSDRFYLSEGVGRRFGDGLATAQYPLESAARLAADPPARVFANLGASGLLLGTTGSTLFIDGRTEAYSSSLWREYLEIKGAGDHALALLDARRVEAVCLAAPGGPFGALAADLLASNRWNLTAAEGAGLLFHREHLAPGPETAPQLAAAKHEVLARSAQAQQQDAGAPRLSAARAADALLAAATLYRLADEVEARRACLEQAVGRSPGHPLARHNLGNLLMADGRFDLALDHFRAATASNRRLAGSWLNGGVCLMRLDRAPEAASWFASAVRLDARSPEAWANLAVARNATGDRTGALAAIERALALSPGNARLAGLRDRLRRPGAPQ